MPRRRSAYNGNYIVDECANLVEDIAGTSTSESAIENFRTLLRNVHNTMKDIKIPNPRSRDNVEKQADGRKSQTESMTVDQLLDYYYPKVSKMKKPMAIMEFLKDNLNADPKISKDQQKRNYRVKPSEWNDNKANCKLDSDKYDLCVLEAVSRNELDDLPKIPKLYEDNAHFQVRDEGLMCETDFYNPGIMHILANPSSKKPPYALLESESDPKKWKSKANTNKTFSVNATKGTIVEGVRPPLRGSQCRRRGSSRRAVRGSSRRKSCRR